MANFQRSYQDSPYHYDMRYGLRQHLADMEWQRGVLSVEVDDMLIGDREAIINRVLTTGPQEEMSPDRKIAEPNISGLDELMFG